MIKKLIPLLSLTALVFGLAACGGGSDNSGVASGGGSAKPSAPASRQAADPADRQLKFAQCMRQNGVDMPDPKPGEPMRIPQNAAPSKLQTATKKCQSYLQGGGGRVNPKDPKWRDAMVKFAQCMRQHGVQMSDPDPNGKMQVPSGSQDKIQKAQQACQKYRPGGGPLGGGAQ